MSQFLNSTAPANAQSAPSGLEALLNGASTANEAPKGLFSSIISAINGDNSPKLADLVQIGTPDQTGQAWLNLQLGDASVSLSAKALTNPLDPNSLLALAPDIIDKLNLDGMADQGLNALSQSIGQTIQTAQNATSPALTTGLQNALLNLQEKAQNPALLALQSTNVADAIAKGTSELLATANQATANQATTATDAAIAQLVEQNPQLSTLVKTVLDQRETVLAQAPASTNPATTIDQQTPKESLAAQLQSQLATAQEKIQAQQNTSQNTSHNTPSTNGSQPNANQVAAVQTATQNPANFAAALSQLPFVQTRQLEKTSDPLLVANTPGQSIAQTQHAALFQPVKAAYQAPQVNLPHMAVAIARNFSAGNNNFQIRLDPAELGRVHIHLSVDDGGTVQAKMLVERPETLQLLQQDSRALERALSQAGLDGARANLEFFQKDNPFAGQQFDHPDQQNDADGDDHQTDGILPQTLTANYQGTITPGGVSLWI